MATIERFERKCVLFKSVIGKKLLAGVCVCGVVELAESFPSSAVTYILSSQSVWEITTSRLK